MQDMHLPKNENLAALPKIAEELRLIRKALTKEKPTQTEEEQQAECKRIISNVFGD